MRNRKLRSFFYSHPTHTVLYCTGAQSDIVLLARSVEGLEETKAKITTSAPGVTVHTIQTNLGDLGSLQKVFSEATKFADTSKHQQFVLVHNAGTIGDISKPLIQHTDPKVVQDYFALNFTSMFTLTAHFLSTFNSGHRTVINIASLLAKVHLPSFSLYGSCKAARNAFMGVLAVENPDVRILNYSPGPCDTKMHKTISEESFSESVVEQFKANYTDKVVLSCQESISKLVGILEEDKFENGIVIDYFD